MVAASVFVGSLFAVCGYNNEVIAVADEGHLVFYSSKTLLKVRSQRVSESRLVGVCAVTVGEQYFVHAVDTIGNYYVIDAATNFVTESKKMVIIAPSTTPAGKPVLGARINTSPAVELSIVSAQWTSVGKTESWEESATSTTIPASLHVVLLTSKGVFTNTVTKLLSSTGNTVGSFGKVIHFPGSLPDLVMAVGAKNGIILVGQRHRTWLWIGSALKAVGTPLRTITLPARLMSIAVTPSNAPSFAIGGDRGEIAFYPTADIGGGDRNRDTPEFAAPLRFFSDHWHSTPLQALAFTEDGRTLLSAAAEKALVSWSVSGAFTRQKIISSAREELTEGYLWKDVAEKKDKKNRFRPKVRKNGEAEAHPFITTDVCSIIIPFSHGTSAVAKSPFTDGSVGCYVVGVTGQVAAMDLREHKVRGSADGFRWSLTSQSAGTDAPSLQAEAVEWMGRPALLVVSPYDSEIRVIDPVTQQSLYTHHTRFNLETSLVNTNNRANDDSSSAVGPLGPYFTQNKDAIDSTNAKGTIGSLLAALADGGRIIFTYEDLSHLGLDSVLRVWRYDPTKQQHLEVQAIYSPHSTEVLKMKTVSIRVPRTTMDGDEAFDVVTTLFTLDRLGVKCWRSVELPSHEARSLTGTQRSYLHLGGVAGAKGEKEADAFMWRVVGSNRCPSCRASAFEVSADGTVLLVGDEVVRAYEVPGPDLALAFTPNQPGRSFAITDWEQLFTLKTAPPKSAGGDNQVENIKFIPDGSSEGIPSIFARTVGGSGYCWQADSDAVWSVKWEAPNVHSTLGASVVDGVTSLAVVEMEKDSSVLVLTDITINKGVSSRKALGPLPTPAGSVRYVVMPHGNNGSSSSSSPTSAFSGRVLGIDAAGVRFVPIAASASAAAIEAFGELKAAEGAARRVDIFFKNTQQVAAEEQAAGEESDNAAIAPSIQTANGLLAKVLSSEAYSAPSIGLVLSSLLGASV